MNNRVFQQRMKEIKGNANAYQDWLERQGTHDEDGDVVESQQANPDSMPERRVSSKERPTKQELILKQAESQLTGRKRQVYKHYMKGDMSIAEIALSLKIKKSTAQSYLDEALDSVILSARAIATEQGVELDHKTNEETKQ